MRKRQVDIAKAEMVAPPVSAIEALRNNLAYQILKRAESRTDKIVDAIADQAEAGDHKSQRLWVDMVTAMAGAPQQQGRLPQQVTNMQQVVAVSTTAHGTISELRHDIVRILAIKGPQSLDDVAEQFAPRGVIRPRVEQALEHDWFEREPDGWHITGKARAEVLESMDTERGAK